MPTAAGLGWAGRCGGIFPARVNAHPHASKRMEPAFDPQRRRGGEINEGASTRRHDNGPAGPHNPADWSGAQAASDNARRGWWVASSFKFHNPLLRVIGKRSAAGWREKSRPLSCKDRWRPPASLPCGVCCRSVAEGGGGRDLRRSRWIFRRGRVLVERSGTSLLGRRSNAPHRPADFARGWRRRRFYFKRGGWVRTRVLEGGEDFLIASKIKPALCSRCS